MSYLDKLEEFYNVCCGSEVTVKVHIECTRDYFNNLCVEIEDEYDLKTVEDVRISPERIPNQLSNIYGVMLHKQLFMFHIKD